VHHVCFEAEALDQQVCGGLLDWCHIFQGDIRVPFSVISFLTFSILLYRSGSPSEITTPAGLLAVLNRSLMIRSFVPIVI